MYTMLTNRRDDKDRDEGFTLIELMVVVLIIAILLAIAIPTFLGAQTSAKDRGAQSTARNALTSAKTVYADSGDYSEADDTALKLIEPGIAFVAAIAPSDGPKSVSVLATDDVWYAAVLSDSGTCYHIRDSLITDALTPPVLVAGTTYGAEESTATGDCIADETVTFDAEW